MYTTLNEYVSAVITSNGIKYVIDNYETIRDSYYAQKQ